MALTDFGAVPASSVLPIYFTSHDAATGANEAASNLAVGDILIYKGTSITQRSSTSGFALIDTDGLDVDGLTGVNAISIDLSDNTDAGFYAVGSFYNVVLGPITIDAQTVYTHLATFRIVAAENTAGYPTVTIKDGTGTGELDTSSGGVIVASIANGAITAAAIATDAIDDDAIATGAIASTAFAAGAITATVIATGAIDADALAADAVTEIAAGLPTAAGIADAVWDEDATAHQTGGTFGQAIGDPGADTNTIFKAVVTDATGATIGVDIVTIDDLLDTEIPALTTAVADLPTNAELATALGTADDAVLAAIAALNNLSAAQVNAEVVDALATDTYAEPSGVPAATDDLATKIGYLYMALRNQVTVTATKKQFFDDSGAAEWEKDLSDDGTTYQETEANAI